jgi:hypothetical protein
VSHTEESVELASDDTDEDHAVDVESTAVVFFSALDVVSNPTPSELETLADSGVSFVVVSALEFVSSDSSG